MTTRAKCLTFSLVLLAAACTDVNVPNTNNPNIDQLLNSPTAATVATATQGLLSGLRGQIGTYTVTAGILGREVYNLDPSEPRTVNGYLVGPLEPGGFGVDFGWSAAYRNLRLAESVLAATDQVSSWSAPQKEAVRGFVKTVEAIDLLGQILVRDTVGIVLTLNGDRSGPLATISTKAEVYAHIVRLLDEARTHLSNGGAAFPFQLHTGFAPFNTPATFIRLNRALKARVEVYRRGYQAALQTLGESFLSTASGSAASLANGAYHVYSAASGDAVHTYNDPTPRALVAVTSFLSAAQNRSDGTPDQRASAKAAITPRTLSQQGVSSNVRLTVYATNTSPVPIIRNEELILLRAEARWFTSDKPGAIADLNFIRTNSGGLAASTLTTASSDDDFITALLYERRYSLFFEYGHRWWDTRRFGRLATLDRVLASHRLFRYVPLPVDECIARTPQPKGCEQEPGI